MYISKEICEALTAKKPEKVNVYNSVMLDYIKKHGNLDSVENYNTGKKDLEPGTYAKKIEIISSGNEPKIYAYVMDNNDNVLFSCRRLGTAAADYTAVSVLSGLYMEIFNTYATINDI